MKRFTLFSIFAIVALAACEREGDGGQYAGVGEGGLRAIIVAPEETRTDFDSYAGKFAWSAGDKIAIHLSDGTFYETAVNAETGAFTCSTTATKKRDAYAVYPASVCDASNYGSPTLNVILPAEYDITGNLSSDNSPVPMIAVNRQAEDDLYFRHVGGLLRITCDKVPVGTQKIAVTLPRNIAGTFAVTNPASENPTISTGGNSQTVTFQVAETALTERTDGIVLNLPVPVGTVHTLKVAALDASGAEIYAETRNVDITIARYQGKKFISLLTEVFSDSMQLLVTAGDETAWTFTVPLLKPNNYQDPETILPASLRILWGDGSWTDVPEGASVQEILAELSHTYIQSGDYTITIEAEKTERDSPYLPTLRFYHHGGWWYNGYFDDSRKMMKACLTPVLEVDPNLGITFQNCQRMESIREDLFIKNPRINGFYETFSGCSGLKGSIPAGLFANNPEVVSFGKTFLSCTGLTGSIPEELFSNCHKVKDMEMAFAWCSGLTGSIPRSLLANCPELSRVLLLFYQCPGLTGSIPEGFFDNNPLITTFQGVFAGCTGLTGSIPAGLFRHCTQATIFFTVFNGCSGLTGSIPEGLFSSCPEATTFYSAFGGCSGLTGTIPAKLFENNTKVTDFRSVFANCSGLAGSIPEDLFANNGLCSSFDYSFHNCSRLTGPIPDNLFAGCPQVSSFECTFKGCSGLSGPIPENLFAGCPSVTSFREVFSGCSGIKTSIPAKLFKENPLVTNYIMAFSNSGVTDGIPASLFASNPEVTTFWAVFAGCSGLTGSIPPGLFAANSSVTDFRSVFFRCTGLTGSIPSGLFDNCPEVTAFGSVFSDCTGLRGEIPHGLFSRNLKVTSFLGAFCNCTNLQLVPDIFTGSTSTSDTRFSQVSVELDSCFENVGGGTPPDLWNYSFAGKSVSRCFHGSTNLVGYAVIPEEWK